MASAGRPFRLEGDLKANVDDLDNHIRKGVIAAANFIAPKAEAYMKQNASWTDRSSAARNGLKAKVQTTPASVAIVLYHSVDYGVWLEIRWAGKYAIVRPAVQAMAPEFVIMIGKLVFK